MRELAWNKDSALPPLGTTDGAVSGAISTYLNRNKVWQEFKALNSCQTLLRLR